MKIFFSTPHGEFRIKNWNFDQTIKDLCFQNKIPYQSVSFYGRKGEDLCLIVGLHQPLHKLSVSFDEIFIKADRNIDYDKIINKKIKIKPVVNPASEWLC